MADIAVFFIKRNKITTSYEFGILEDGNFEIKLFFGPIKSDSVTNDTKRK